MVNIPLSVRLWEDGIGLQLSVVDLDIEALERLIRVLELHCHSQQLVK
jgi:hypothetical protein